MWRREDRGPPEMPVAEEGEAAAFVAPEEAAPALPGPAPLCGPLSLLCGKGPLRGFRSRWFVFHPRRCRLTYHKGPQEPALGSIDISDASFGLSPEEEEGLFHIRSEGRDCVLKAQNRQVMAYWLQELQQKRWEYSNHLGAGKRDSLGTPTPLDLSKGLVAKDNPDYLSVLPNSPAEKARNILAVETDPGELVGEQAANHPPSAQFSLKQLSADISFGCVPVFQYGLRASVPSE